MRFDGWNTMEGRHLVFAYAAVILIQGGYLGWIAIQWNKLSAKTDLLPNLPTNKKATKP